MLTVTKSMQVGTGEPVDIVLMSHTGYNQAQLVKLNLAVDITEQVFNSVEFRDKVMAFRFTSTYGWTNKQLYELAMSGANEVDPKKDGKIQIYVTLYKANNNTIGYTYPSTEETWMNSKYFDKMSVAGVVGNIAHENVGHKLGFDHESADEYTSFPYAIGNIAEELAEMVLKGRKLTPVFAIPAPTPEIPKPKPVPVETKPVSVPTKIVTCKRRGWWPFWPTRVTCVTTWE